jgi:Acetyltransferase (GNAT) domain
MTQQALYAVQPSSHSSPVLEDRYKLIVNGFLNCAWCSIFNTSRFFNLHKSGSSFYFQLCLGDLLETVGVVHFTEVEPGYFRSPKRGTFGGFEFNRSLRIEVIERFVDEVEQVLRQEQAHKIEILDPPAAFDPCNSGVLSNVLYRRGFMPQAPELAYLLTVDEKPLWEKLKPNRRQRINRCEREGIEARRVEAELHKEVYDVIVENRTSKSFPVTMSYEAILEMLGAFPGQLLFFGAFKDGTMIASSICVKVSNSVLYVFYWGDRPGYERFSPVTLLAQCIYEYAQSSGFKLIDFGTATRAGIPIYGLISFKKEIGCFPSPKPAYVKLLA